MKTKTRKRKRGLQQDKVNFNEGVKSINSLNGYEEAIKINGVYAIHITPLK